MNWNNRQWLTQPYFVNFVFCEFLWIFEIFGTFGLLEILVILMCNMYRDSTQLLFTTYLTNYDVTVTYCLLVYLFTTHNSRDQSIQLIRRKISLHNQSKGLIHFGGNFWWGEREESKSLVGRPPAEEGEVPETNRTGTHKSCKLL